MIDKITLLCYNNAQECSLIYWWVYDFKNGINRVCELVKGIVWTLDFIVIKYDFIGVSLHVILKMQMMVLNKGVK